MATKAYTRIFSNDAQPHRNVEPSIVIAGTKMRVQRVKLASEGRITELTVQQTAGAATAFTVELLKTGKLWNFNVDIPAVDYATPADVLSLYRIIPLQAGAPGVALELDKDSPGYNFVNIDGTPTNNERFVYLVIVPTGAAGSTTWKASVTIAMDVPSS